MSMTNTKTLPGRPTDPRKISFAAECFEVVGTRTEYRVLRSALHPGPMDFGTDREAAEVYARRCGRVVQTVEVQITRRIKWTLD